MRMMSLRRTLGIAFAAFVVQTAVADNSQVEEARAVFDGVKVSAMRGGTWKVVYATSEGPEGKALEVLTERLGPTLLREEGLSTAMVLPLEKAGGSPVGKRDKIVLGVLGKNPALDAYVKAGDVPRGGYLVRTLHESGRNVVILAGAGPCEVLWATFDFLDVVVPTLNEVGAGENGEVGWIGPAARYEGCFFRRDRIPDYTFATAPETSVRSIFSWGHVQDDLRNTFRGMAGARFNRAIFWNDQTVVNAATVVKTAHEWGIQVYWGFSWGWTLSGKDGPVDFDRLADEIVAEWREKWKPMGGDGIYFQSFTETNKNKIGGRSIPEAVAELVNKVSARIRAEAPGTDIVFGLHSNSMRQEGTGAALKKIDPSIEILWENCGGFPYYEADGKVIEPDVEFNDRILALTPNVGLVWKAQLRIDWKHYVPPAGPFLLGCAGERLLRRDRDVTAPLQGNYDEDWLLNGKSAYDLIRHLRSGKNLPKELNAVAEYNPPYGLSTLIQAELFWNSSDSWEAIVKRARRRTRSVWGRE